MSQDKNNGQEQGQALQLARELPVIETASATTSPDNVKSGPAAYVIFGVAAALMLVCSVVVFGALASFVGLAAQDSYYGYGNVNGYNYDDGYGPFDNDLEDLMDELGSEFGGSGETSLTQS